MSKKTKIFCVVVLHTSLLCVGLGMHFSKDIEFLGGGLLQLHPGKILMFAFMVLPTSFPGLKKVSC